MKTKLVYVLVSNDNDYYYEMVVMSLYSFRLYHPFSKVEIVMDRDTYQRLKEKPVSILGDVTPVVVDIPSEYNVVQRSRYLKTNLRQFIEGDFLFIDCDTLICGSLEKIDNVLADIGMVSDLNRAFPLLDSRVVALNQQAGFSPTSDEPYYNGGVAYVKDTPVAHHFFYTWFHNWQLSVEKGVSKDQPSLCESNKDLGFPIQELSACWNCQMGGKNTRYIYKAKILHYFNIMEYGKVKKKVLERIKETGRPDALISVILHFPRLMFYMIYLKHYVRDSYYRIRDFYYWHR